MKVVTSSAGVLSLTLGLLLAPMHACIDGKTSDNVAPVEDTIGANLDATGADASPADSVEGPDTSASDHPTADTSIELPEYLGGDRPALVYLPYDYDGETPVPLVILLHGFTASGAIQNSYFGFSNVTRDKGMLLLLPNGTINQDGNRFWNATDACCDLYGSGVDDVAYLKGLIQEAKDVFNVDAERVFLVGHSNGGFMSFRMACDASDVVTGIVSLAGSTWLEPEDCGDPEPVSVLDVHGTWDMTIRYDGLKSQTGNPNAVLDMVGCLTAHCSGPYLECNAHPECSLLSACVNTCSLNPDPQGCRDACFAEGTPAAQDLWMAYIVCGLGAGCFDDPKLSYPGYPGAQEVVERWATRNGCVVGTTEGTPLDLVGTLPGDETKSQYWDDCEEGSRVELWTIEKGSHVPTFNANWSASIVDWLLAL